MQTGFEPALRKNRGITCPFFSVSAPGFLDEMVPKAGLEPARA